MSPPGGSGDRKVPRLDAIGAGASRARRDLTGISESFGRDDRLRKRREFEECYASGIKCSGRFLQVFLMPEEGRPRLGISVPKRVGVAVVRNRVRRRLREIFRRNRASLGGRGLRIVVNARPASAQAPFADLLEDYQSAVRRALARVQPGAAH